ncbi:uncharacterized protein [Porites lutea]|uniref:uncharacterized protein isoform X3 n=1 Tax=Porites lutea TaxID=51062 RepID=UPI003CC52E0A
MTVLSLLHQWKVQLLEWLVTIADAFRQIFHSLDVWHKSKGIRKCLSNVGSTKGMEKVALWSDHIVRHFWHCCSLASEVEGNELEALKILKDTWISLLHPCAMPMCAINMSGLMAIVTTSQSLRKTTSFHGLTGDPKSLRHCKKLSWILTFLKVSSTTPDSGIQAH